jgi:multidrug efflux pump subunit AcrB
VLFVIYALLAIPFRSYIQPVIVMSVIPFGAAGAMLGHILMGMNLTIMSLMGMLALTGVVVNDSLVLVDYINRRRAEGVPLHEAVSRAGIARLRPVLLTSLTTFAGLTPLIFERSTQAQFLIPMAVSLGFGILFATFVTLLLVPLNYLVLEDIRGLGRRVLRRGAEPPAEEAAARG